MEITVKNEYRVEVGLTDAELSRLGVSFESLDYGKIETRRALWTVVGELRKQGVEVRLSGRVLIEAEKTEAGCRLSITSLPSKSADERSVKQLVKSPPLPAVFASENREALDRAARLLGPDAVTALYHTRDRWFLLVNGGCGEEALLRAAEYCPAFVPADDLFRAFLEEHAPLREPPAGGT